MTTLDLPDLRAADFAAHIEAAGLEMAVGAEPEEPRDGNASWEEVSTGGAGAEEEEEDEVPLTLDLEVDVDRG